MKVAILSDIHGNIDALNAVLNMAKEHQVDQLLILGDFVGYYYYPNLVLDALSTWNCQMIKGNHEEILEQLDLNQVDTEIIQKKYGIGHKVALDKLTLSQKKFLFALPNSKSIIIEGLRILMCHGSNFDKDYYLYPNEESSTLDKCVSKDYDFIFVGHSHYPFVRSKEGTTLVNSGSVGQSRLVGGIANWVILHTNNQSVQFMNTQYNSSAMISEIKKVDPNNEYLWKILERSNG